LVCWWWWCWIMSTYLLNILSFLCSSFPTRIITSVAFLLCIFYIVYFHKLITLIASLLLLVLIVIYDEVGTYNGTVIMDWGLVCCWWCVYCHVHVRVIRSPKVNYYTIIPSMYDQLGDSVDCSIWWDHVVMDMLVQGWQCNNHSCHVTISIVCPVIR